MASPLSVLNRRRARNSAALFHARAKNAEAALVNDPTSMAWGYFTFALNPSNGATITLNGKVITFGSDVGIGGSLSSTMSSLLAFLNGSSDTEIVKCTYSVIDGMLNIRAKAPNLTGYTLAASVATRSAATLQLVQIRKRSF
jgi:hypothetical protein